MFFKRDCEGIWTNVASYCYCCLLQLTVSNNWKCFRWAYSFLPTRWRHQMKIFFGLLAICVRSSQVSGEFPSQRPVSGDFDVFFELHLNNDWVNNHEAGDLRHHHAHYDIILMNILNNCVTVDFDWTKKRHKCVCEMLPSYSYFTLYFDKPFMLGENFINDYSPTLNRAEKYVTNQYQNNWMGGSRDFFTFRNWVICQYGTKSIILNLIENQAVLLTIIFSN